VERTQPHHFRVESRMCGSLALLPIDKVQGNLNDTSYTRPFSLYSLLEGKGSTIAFASHASRLTPGRSHLPCKPRIGGTSTSDDLPDSLTLREDNSVRGALLRIPISRYITPHWWYPNLHPRHLSAVASTSVSCLIRTLMKEPRAASCKKVRAVSGSFS
jgi:hypothetical protein